MSSRGAQTFEAVYCQQPTQVRPTEALETGDHWARNSKVQSERWGMHEQELQVSVSPWLHGLPSCRERYGIARGGPRGTLQSPVRAGVPLAWV